MSSSPDACVGAELSDDNHEEHSSDSVILVNGDAHVDNESIGEEFNTLSGEFDTLSLSDTDLGFNTCPKCKDEFIQPRVLSCLHVFCEDCLKPLLIEDSVECPTCNKNTDVECVTELPLDYTIANDLDMKGIEDMNMTCTSCKAREKAISRCSDCANFLCPNCVTAHQFMRCFENHKVVSFDNIINQEGMSIHRPIVCTLHGEDQPMKYFCNTCQIPICNECMMIDHQAPAHRFERISDIEERELNIMKSLIGEAEVKVKKCEEVSNNLQQSLGDLESERDDAKSLINETFQSYKALLEKRQESLLSQLEELHKQQELSVMEMFNEVNITVDEIEHGSGFVQRVVDKSNSLELLSLKKVMHHYLTSLVSKPLRDSISVDIKFVTDNQEFQAAVTEHFGHFKLRDESVLRNQQQQQQMHQIRQIERQTCRAKIATSEGYTTRVVSPPPLMPSGPYGDMHPITVPIGSPDSGHSNDHNFPMRPIRSNDFINSSMFPPSNNPPNIGIGDSLGWRNSSVTSLSGMSGAGVIGDQQGLASQSRQSQSPTISDSGIGIDTSGSSGAQNTQSPKSFNVSTIGPQGTVGVGLQGQVMVNNHALPGMSVHSIPGLDHAFPGSAVNLTVSNTSSPDQDLPLGRISGMFSSPPPQGRSMNPPCGGGPMDSMMGQRRDSASISMASGVGSSSGFTSPPLSQQSFSGASLPIRSKMSAMQIRHKFGSLGPSKVQFNSPHGFCMGFEEDIVVADTNNHRIQVFDKGGEFKYQFGIPGREEGQLWYPRKVAVMRGTSRYVICDRGNERSRMQIFSKNGHFVKKIAIRYIDIVAGLAITPAGNIVAVDSVSPTVFTIAESGDLIKWFDCSDYMREPSDIAVADKEYYVCDFKGHCVVVFNDDGQFMRRIGTDTITNFPNGIDISDAGDVLVGDSHGNRFHVAVFQRDGSLIGEFECPYVKVSRCCGLKITSEGYVVTLAKNNHHVLVLNTLYIS